MTDTRETPYSQVMNQTEHEGDCLVFTGPRNRMRYGRMNGPYDEILAHRVVWAHHHGAIPQGVVVCHHCDNPPCVKIEHLFAGTMRDNMQDAMRKGRLARLYGTENHSAKLSWDHVCEIRELALTGQSHRQIAERYGVHETTVGQIVRRQRRLFATRQEAEQCMP